MVQSSLSDNAIRFLARLISFVRLDPYDPEFIIDAEAIEELKKALTLEESLHGRRTTEHLDGR